MGRRKTGDKRYPRLSLCARRTKSCRCAPPSFPAEEQVRAHRSHLVQAAAPIRHDPVGMVMGGVSDGTEYCSRESCARNAACPFPCRLRWHAGQSAIAGKGKLTTGNAFRSLEHHAANSVRKRGMAQALERTEARRGGKECGSTYRSRWSPYE